MFPWYLHTYYQVPIWSLKPWKYHESGLSTGGSPGNTPSGLFPETLPGIHSVFARASLYVRSAHAAGSAVPLTDFWLIRESRQIQWRNEAYIWRDAING